MDTSFASPGPWGGGEKCSSLFVGSAIENIIQQSQKEFSPRWLYRPRSFLNSAVPHCTPTGQPGTRHDTACLASVGAEDMYLTSAYLELGPCKQIPLPYFQVAPNSVNLGCLTHCYPLDFQTGILEFCHPVPRTFLSLHHSWSARFWENNRILEPGHYALKKQAISSWYVCANSPETSSKRERCTDLEWPLPNRILKTSGQLLCSLITYYCSFKNKK